jgi:hypothetical protein
MINNVIKITIRGNRSPTQELLTGVSGEVNSYPQSHVSAISGLYNLHFGPLFDFILDFPCMVARLMMCFEGLDS